MVRLVLWDVDHTLIENAGVSKEIYAAAYLELTGIAPTHSAVTEGRTDPDIMADLLRSHASPEVAWDRVETALRYAGARHRQALADRGWVLPGVHELLIALADAGTAQTIVSGNIRANAEVKVAGFGLLDWLDLDIGGYGSDSRDRAELVSLAKSRAARKYAHSRIDATVIGDTPRDVEAAHRGGARVLAVASGVHSESTLRAAGADMTLPDLSDTAAALAFVLAWDV
ncbi:HAD family hydrolase [Microlunatus ginsengisoli]|uniref:Haloacid dehalogenase-like hydrolase n=1 Tax=Microlunatus ginsengisoli TaxID=363863 RepID=A0ABP7ANQ0_9ACTN